MISCDEFKVGDLVYVLDLRCYEDGIQGYALGPKLKDHDRFGIRWMPGVPGIVLETWVAAGGQKVYIGTHWFRICIKHDTSWFPMGCMSRG